MVEESSRSIDGIKKPLMLLNLMHYTTKSRLALSASLLLMWVGLIAMESRAVFTDEVSLTGNSITTGSVNLLISNSQNPSSTTFEKTREGFSFTLLPGQSAEKYFLLKNASAYESNFEIGVKANLPSDVDEVLAQSILLEITPVDGEGNTVSGQIIYDNLAGLKRDTYPILGPLIPKGGIQRYRIKTTMAENYKVPQVGVTYDLIFQGVQKVI